MKRGAKNRIRSAFAMACVAMMMLVMWAVPVFAQGNVSYEGDSKSVVFSPGSDESPTDLFVNFKKILPGDSMTDKIEVRNNSDKDIRVYLRATGAEAGSESFLNQLQLTVTSEGGDTIFKDAADKTAGLTDWVLIGTLKPEGKTVLDIALSAPIEMGNNYQDSIGYLNWQFKVEEVEEPDPTDPTDPTTGPTKTTAPTDPTGNTTSTSPSNTSNPSGNSSETNSGDDTLLYIFIIALLTSVFGVAFFTKRRLKAKDRS